MFHFEIVHVPETENVLEEALQELYMHVAIVVYHDVGNIDFEISGDLPILAGLEDHAAVHRHPRKIVPVDMKVM